VFNAVEPGPALPAGLILLCFDVGHLGNDIILRVRPLALPYTFQSSEFLLQVVDLLALLGVLQALVVELLLE
jgi:hypothetical protein